MKTEQVLQRLANDVAHSKSEHIYLRREDAQRILERVNSLEGIAADLLKSVHDGIGTIVNLRFKSKP